MIAILGAFLVNVFFQRIVLWGLGFWLGFFVCVWLLGLGFFAALVFSMTRFLPDGDYVFHNSSICLIS